jgi:hypothetical protein
VKAKLLEHEAPCLAMNWTTATAAFLLDIVFAGLQTSAWFESHSVVITLQ